MTCYYLHWRGQRLGPYTVDEIDQKLAEGEIGLYHLVGDESAGITVGGLLQQVSQEKRAAQLVQEQTREREQREARQRAEYRHSQAIQRLQEENEVLAGELENIKATQQTTANVPTYPVVPGYTHFPQAPVIVQRTSGQAITAFVFSLLTFVPGICFISWLIALILAYSALADMRRDPSLGGRGLALAALWITYTLFFVGLIIGLLIIIGEQR